MIDNIIKNKQLPKISEKELVKINTLMTEKQYRIKNPPTVFGFDKLDRINHDFIHVFLHDSLGHVQQCVTATKKILPDEKDQEVYEKWKKIDKDSYTLLTTASTIDLKSLLFIYHSLEKKEKDVFVKDLIPFIYVLFNSIIKFYYLGLDQIKTKYNVDYKMIVTELTDVDKNSLQQNIDLAIQKHSVILNTIVPRLYPLLLRMCSPVFLSQKDLFYANGSLILKWLDVDKEEVLVHLSSGVKKRLYTELAKKKKIERPRTNVFLSEELKKGFETLELLFPEAGWENIDLMPDFCPYFMNILNLPESIVILSPENPLQLTLIFLVIIEFLFQGMKQIKFNMIDIEGEERNPENIYRIMEDWIQYKETIIEKDFATDLKSFTSQMYTKPDYYKNPYGIKNLTTMHMIIKSYFLPYFDVQKYKTNRIFKSDSLSPFYLRVARLKKILNRYGRELKNTVRDRDLSINVPVSGIQNPWDEYRFDVPNALSVRLDTLLGGSNIKNKTNAFLINFVLDIVTVLDWWINDKNSIAYKNVPETLYRVVEKGNLTPMFSVVPRTDVEALFVNSLKYKRFLF